VNLNVSSGAVLAVGALVGVVIIARTFKAPAAAALDAINPTSPNNIVYRGANSLVQAITGDPYGTVGTKWWEFWNRDQVARERAALSNDAPPVSTPGIDNEDRDLGGYFADYAQQSGLFHELPGGAAVGLPHMRR
jgi:hypothetical protein